MAERLRQQTHNLPEQSTGVQIPLRPLTKMNIMNLKNSDWYLLFLVIWLLLFSLSFI